MWLVQPDANFSRAMHKHSPGPATCLQFKTARRHQRLGFIPGEVLRPSFESIEKLRFLGQDILSICFTPVATKTSCSLASQRVSCAVTAITRSAVAPTICKQVLVADANAKIRRQIADGQGCAGCGSALRRFRLASPRHLPDIETASIPWRV